MNVRRVLAVIFVLVAGGLAIVLPRKASDPFRCAGIDAALPDFLSMTPERMKAMIPLTERDGIVSYRYPDDRGLQTNPWTVAWYGLLQAQAYCRDRDETRIPVIRAHRDWLIQNMERRQTPDGKAFAVATYSYPTKPWTSAGGWASALSQSAAMSFLNRTAETPLQREAAAQAAVAMTTPSKDGGIYTKFGDNIVWQEVATRAGESNIINGHAAALFIVSHETEFLDLDPQIKADLLRLSDQGRLALLQMMKTYIPKLNAVLYDVGGVGAYRPRGEYSHRLVVSVLRWLESEGAIARDEVDRIERAEPAKG